MFLSSRLGWSLESYGDNFLCHQPTDDVCVKSARKNISKDLKDRWVTNLTKQRKRFDLVTTQLDPVTKMISFCDNKYFPSSWKDDDNGLMDKQYLDTYRLVNISLLAG
jgi:hypothetical protein